MQAAPIKIKCMQIFVNQTRPIVRNSYGPQEKVAQKILSSVVPQIDTGPYKKKEKKPC